MTPVRRAVLLLIVSVVYARPARAQYTDQRAFDELGGVQEFARRRAELVKAIKPGFAILFARIDDPEATLYREDNDFYYFTGISDPGAVLLIDGDSGETRLYEPEQLPRIKVLAGANLLGLPAEEQKRYGFTSVQSLNDLVWNLALLTSRPGGELWARLSYSDQVDRARSEVGLLQAFNTAHPFGDGASRDRDVIVKLRKRFPQMPLRDVAPVIDRMRNIKTAAEMDILRRNGQLSAAGIRTAIARARPGMYEYQLAAHATFSFTMAGAQGVAYPAVVASGPNAIALHYFSNRRQMQPDDLVVFDFAADLDHLTMDITRTFNVSGRFSPEQAKWYAVVLEAQTALINMLRPGNTYEQAIEAGRRVFEKSGVLDQWAAGEFPGHFVGESTHDVNGPPNAVGRASTIWWAPTGPVSAGQVVAVEPTITFEDKHLHIRIEDTVLITSAGPEVLTSGVPKTLDAIQALVGSDQSGSAR
jgi:Xaa-Pro aminopeptidase